MAAIAIVLIALGSLSLLSLGGALAEVTATGPMEWPVWGW